MKNEDQDQRDTPADQHGDGLPYPDSGWLPGLQRTIKRKLENGEIDEVDADIFHGMMGQISEEKEGGEES